MKVEVEQVLHMVGGSGETSYSTNSRIQEIAISEAKAIVDESISDVYCTLVPKSMAVADLGCASGPTAFMVISNVVSSLSDVCSRLNRRTPEILFFLNDLPGNDFNTIFKSLTVHEKKLREENGEKTLPYYVVGAPGSFYGRLFPKESIHFMHSSYSLHWLSQVPQRLENNGGVLMNCGNIYMSRTSPSCVFEAYLEQYRKDFSRFLNLRAEEIIPGGQMVLTILCRTSVDPLKGEMTQLLDLISEALNTIASEGHIDKAKVDEFNIPFYAPAWEEVRDVVKNEGSFDVLQKRVFKLNWDPYDHNVSEEFVIDNKSSGQNAARCVRAALEPMFADQFGGEIIDTLFSRYAENVSRHLLEQKTKLANLTITLKKRN